jgi:hypothetical protein
VDIWTAHLDPVLLRIVLVLVLALALALALVRALVIMMIPAVAKVREAVLVRLPHKVAMMLVPKSTVHTTQTDSQLLGVVCEELHASAAAAAAAAALRGSPMGAKQSNYFPVPLVSTRKTTLKDSVRSHAGQVTMLRSVLSPFDVRCGAFDLAALVQELVLELV